MEALKPAQTGFFITDEHTNEQIALFNGAVVGRTQGDFLFQADPRMSGKHARFTVDGADVFIEDLGSRNGILVNSKKIPASQPHRLYPGDMVSMGDHIFCLGRFNGTPINSFTSPKEDTSTFVTPTAAPQPKLVEEIKSALQKNTPKSAPKPQAPTPLAPPTPLSLNSAHAPQGLWEHLMSTGKEFEETIERLNMTTLSLLTLGMAALYAVLSYLGSNPLLPAQTDLLKFGANYAPLTSHHQWWRLVASAFVHSSLLHLFINQMLIWQAGLLIARSAGGLGVLCVFIFAQVAGSIFSIAYQPSVIFVGAGPAVLGCLGAAIAALLRDDDLRKEASIGALAMGTLVFFAANLKTGLRIPMDAAQFGISFGVGFGLQLIMAPSPNYRETPLWLQIVRPLLTGVVCFFVTWFAVQHIKPIEDTGLQLSSIVERLIPIAESNETLRKQIKKGEMKTTDAFREIEREHLPKLRALETELAALRPFSDERKDAQTYLRSALRSWIESWELQSQALTSPDFSLITRGQEAERSGLDSFEKANSRFHVWKTKSQNEVKP